MFPTRKYNKRSVAILAQDVNPKWPPFCASRLVAMSSAVMAEQQRSELQSSLNLQLAQAREEVRKEAAESQAAAVAVVATERDDAKAALLLAAKEAQDEVAEAQMLQQERVAAVEKQLVSKRCHHPASFHTFAFEVELCRCRELHWSAQRRQKERSLH